MDFPSEDFPLIFREGKYSNKYIFDPKTFSLEFRYVRYTN